MACLEASRTLKCLPGSNPFSRVPLSLFIRRPQRLAYALLLACLASACGLIDLDDPGLPGGQSELLDAGAGAAEAGSGWGLDAAGLHEAAVPVDAAPVPDARPAVPAGPEPGLLA